MPSLRRRELLGAGAAGAAAVAVGARSAPAAAKARTYDVVVVGAGLAGLSAAREVRRAGRSVLVLEARRRVGGRNLDHHLPGSRDVVELGGQWAGPGQDRVLALAKEFGIATFPTYDAGDSVYVRGGARKTYSGDIPPASAVALVQAEAVILRLNQMAATVPADSPWTAPQAAAWDEQSIGGWVDANTTDAEARALARLAIRGVYGEEAELVSLLDGLSAISGVGGDFDTLIGSAQSIRFVGGPQQLSIGLAKRLGRTRVRMGAEVVAVERGRRDAAVVLRDGVRLRARRIVLAIPKPLIFRLRFAPALPPAFDQLLQRQPMGSVLKINAIYDEPFWRAEGLSGSATSTEGPIEITYDNSPRSGKPGVLVGFAEGEESRRLYRATPSARRAAVLQSLARLFGPRAARPRAYVDHMWAVEEFTRGAYGSYNPPGVLTALGAATAGPVDRLHFAGADFSPEWPGYMDGAIRSGTAAGAAAVRALK